MFYIPNSLKFLVLTSALLALQTSASLAQHSDVLLADVGGQVAIGTAEEIGDPNNEAFALGAGAFETILLPGFPPVFLTDYFADEPGFFGLDAIGRASELAALGANALPGGAAVSISTTSFTIDGASAELFYWDGLGAVDFDPAPAGTTFSFNPSASFASSGANGAMDDHPVYQLDAAGGGAPADGVYLISPVIDVAGLTTSDSFYMVLLAESLIGSVNIAEDDAEAIEEHLEELEAGGNPNDVDFGNGNVKGFAFFEEAVEYVEENLVIPEPATGLSALIALALLIPARNRCRMQ